VSGSNVSITSTDPIRTLETLLSQTDQTRKQTTLMTAKKKDWIMTEDAFNALLDCLDADRDCAGEKYEKIRQKLMKFFKWRGCLASEEYADRTIDRVARRLNEGADLRGENPYSYFHGVALNLLKEHWREPEREQERFDELPQARAPFQNPFEQSRRETEKVEKDRQLGCLASCVKNLPEDSLDLITRYHSSEGLIKDRRRELAESLKIPMSVLRVRAHRIRAGLESCVTDCLKRLEEL
jgi:DNA-directed RNA polymerase specialized sigma24 family protein